jgi:hypothetical protein
MVLGQVDGSSELKQALPFQIASNDAGVQRRWKAIEKWMEARGLKVQFTVKNWNDDWWHKESTVDFHWPLYEIQWTDSGANIQLDGHNLSLIPDLVFVGAVSDLFFQLLQQWRADLWKGQTDSDLERLTMQSVHFNPETIRESISDIKKLRTVWLCILDFYETYRDKYEFMQRDLLDVLLALDKKPKLQDILLCDLISGALKLPLELVQAVWHFPLPDLWDHALIEPPAL